MLRLGGVPNNRQELVADTAGIEQRLAEGAVRARAVATPFLRELRLAVGLGTLDTTA